jgi:hypothetical protein
MLFAVRKKPEETYCDMFRHVEDARNKTVRVTPPSLSTKQQFDETSLFSALHALPPDDLLRHQPTSQKDVSLRDPYLAFLSSDRCRKRKDRPDRGSILGFPKSSKGALPLRYPAGKWRNHQFQHVETLVGA